MRRWVIALVSALAALGASCRELPRRAGLELDGEWEFRRAPAGAWRPATVPGCVHADLLAEGLIEDPLAGAREGELRWIEEADWEYRTIFDVPRELLESERLELDFQGLDTYAEISLNDSLLCRADNMFRRWRVPCEGLLRASGNVLRVYFRSPVKTVEAAWNALDPKLPGGPRVLTRKAAYQYGWDWAPRYVTSGVWRPVYLRAWGAARILDLEIVQKRVTERSAALAARFEIEASAAGRVALAVYFGDRSVANAAADLVAGTNTVSVDFEVPEPRLWWTNGLGEPHLYHCLGELKSGGVAIDWAERWVGIRTIELVEERDAAGRSFSFRLNGVPLFIKGANYVPPDCFPSRVTPRQREYLVAAAADAGMNMLRVWGGGLYEDDSFYDLCDEYGILVWQDFMFACAMYPGDEAFLANVEQEAVENVERLRGHACIALWCGNNESDEGWRHWGWQRELGISAADSLRIWGDYETLFHVLLPSVVARCAPGTPYVPSSPRYGRAEARSLEEGDSHYWGVWHDGEPFEILSEKIPRFMSEFGFQALPALSTIEGFAGAGETVDSSVLAAHQKHPRGGEIILSYMERSYRVPNDLASFAYVSQLLQAEGMKIGIEAERRAMPRCMGTMYWQLDDCWPAVSWSSIDYYGVPKALYYFARRAYRDVLVSPVVENGAVRVYVVSDRQEPFDARVTLELVDFTGETVWRGERRTSIRERSARLLFEAELESFLRGRAASRVVLRATVRENGELLSENLLYFAPPKDLELPAPRFVRSLGGASVASVVEDESGYAVTLCPECLVKNVSLSIDGHDGIFDDNFFDMLPGSCVTVHFLTGERIDDFDESLRIMSLWDTYGKGN